MDITLSDLVTWEKYTEEHKHIFPSEQAWRWEMRRYGPALRAAGAVVRLRGRDYVNVKTFDRVRVGLEGAQ